MNNKKIGSDFELKFCNMLKNDGWWVHFCYPSPSGQQPTDIVACKDNQAMIVDCKTSAKHIFPLSRLEDDQVSAFERFIKTGNIRAYVSIEYKSNVYLVPYLYLKNLEKIDLDEEGNGYLYQSKN